jgi:hypothetical protein
LLTRYAYLSGALSGVPEGVAFSPFQVVKVSSCSAAAGGGAHAAVVTRGGCAPPREPALPRVTDAARRRVVQGGSRVGAGCGAGWCQLGWWCPCTHDTPSPLTWPPPTPSTQP